MGDYYKIKKILLILIIVLTIIRIFKTSNVFASEAVEVTPVWNDGDYTYQSDNQFLTLRQNQLDIQNSLIYHLGSIYNNGNNTQKLNVVNTCKNIMSVMSSRSNAAGSTKFIWFTRILDSNDYAYGYQLMSFALLNNIVYADATLDSGYKILSVPFYSFNRSAVSCLRGIHKTNGNYTDYLTSGNVTIPVAEVGCYSDLWLEFFTQIGIMPNNNTMDYSNLLESIEETNELNYTQNLYTKQAVQNTYNYLTNDSIEEISSLGISQPEISENIDLTDVFDSLEELLTNETYTSKYFTFSLPGNRNFNFTLRPDYLETSLTRVGGSSIISIIHALWYIGLYGWYIFAYLGIFGKLLTGDLFHLVKGCSPVTNLVKMSVGSITGGKY